MMQRMMQQRPLAAENLRHLALHPLLLPPLRSRSAASARHNPALAPPSKIAIFRQPHCRREELAMIRQPAPKPDVMARRDSIVAGLRALLPDSGVIAETLRLKPYETDGLSAYRQPPLVVVLPETTEQVAAVLHFCHKNGVRIVPRGAGTSLSGGALPMEDAVVVGMMRMNQILDINFPDRTAVVQAGVTNIGITNAVAGNGFFYAPD